MINKLISNIRKTNAPIVVGLDPMLNYIPEHIQKKAFAEFRLTATVIATSAAKPSTLSQERRPQRLSSRAERLLLSR